MTMETIRGFVASLEVAEDDHVYMGALDAKKDCSVGVYNYTRSAYRRFIGESGRFNVKRATLLIHWNRSPRESEAAARRLFEALEGIREYTTGNNECIFFIAMGQNEPVDIGKDSAGVCEYVLDIEIYYKVDER